MNPVNPVFCIRCRQQIDSSDVFCQYCGANQRIPLQQPTPDPTLTVPAAQQAQATALQHQQVAQQQGLATKVGVRDLLLYFTAALLVVVTVMSVSAYFHIQAELNQTRQELAETRKGLSDTQAQLVRTHTELSATQSDLDSLTGTVNHNASVANHNAGLWP